MKVIIAGSREGFAHHNVWEAIEESGFRITEVVSGCAKGVDTMGEQWAKAHDTPIKPFPAEWQNFDLPDCVIKYDHKGRPYNATAGFSRNKSMGDYADALIAVWDGKSSGTKHMITYMKSLGKKIFLYTK